MLALRNETVQGNDRPLENTSNRNSKMGPITTVALGALCLLGITIHSLFFKNREEPRMAFPDYEDSIEVALQLLEKELEKLKP